jgi:hypothetical protein
MEKKSIKDVVREVCAEWKPGEELLGYQIHQRVMGRIRMYGMPQRPLDGTVLRRLREVSGEYGIQCVGGDSRYVKKILPFPSRDDRAGGGLYA